MENTSRRTLADLDDVDLQIIRLLQEDGRNSNVEIARRTGVSEPTVRKRIERLIQDGIMRITAVLNPRTAGYNAGMVIGIGAFPGRAQEVAEQMLPLNEVVYVGYVAGRFDLIIEVLLRDEEEMLDFLSRRLGDFPGIATFETFHILRADKINFDWKLPESAFPTTRAAEDERQGDPAPNGRRRAGDARVRNGQRATRRAMTKPGDTTPGAPRGSKRS